MCNGRCIYRETYQGTHRDSYSHVYTPSGPKPDGRTYLNLNA